jgi:formate hydrogenlyase subunit 3/multisubunit Na+/H+ antiporter MnhD subunit
MIEACAIAVLVLAGSGLAALAATSRPRLATRIAAVGAIAAAAIGVPAAIAAMSGAATTELQLAWPPPLRTLTLGLDPLSAFFVLPLLVLGAACAVYGAAYLDPRRSLGIPSLCFNLLLAAMLLVLLARNSVVLLFGWEVMTLASYLLITFEHEQEEIRRAGWIYLIAGHLGFACLVVVFLLLADGGGFDWAGTQGGAVGAVAIVFAILGFGVKAGVVPLHVWLPEAHAAAPSHVSAMMSGGMIKLGVYGILRTLTLVEPTAWRGPVLVALGVLSAVGGIALGIYQRDLKRTLAYSSIENIGVILLGLGIGLIGVSTDRPVIAAFGLIGGLLHVWSHVLMKGLLFLGAGSILHATGTRDVERHGGLLARMPRTGFLMVIGATAITALPPLAGFASEWLVYLGLLEGSLHPSGTGLAMILGVAALATVGVLAALCFVRAIGLALLGQPRSVEAEQAHESGPGLLVPMAVLAAGVVAMPFVAWLLVRVLDPVAEQIARAPLATDRVASSLQTIAVLSAGIWAAFGLGFLVLARRARRRRVDDTWGCGYAAPTPRMQYTSGSFSEAAQILLPRLLRPRVAIRRDAGAFPEPGQLTSDRRDPFTRSGYEPVFDQMARRAGRLRWVQQGLLHLYILFIVGTVVVLLAAVSLYDWWAR